MLNFIDRDWGLYKQVSEFEGGPRFLNAVGFDAANNRPIYRFSAPTIIETTVFGENPSRRAVRRQPVALGHAAWGQVHVLAAERQVRSRQVP